MKKKGVQSFHSTLPRLGTSAAELTTSEAEADAHVVVAGTAGNRTAITGDTTSVPVGESLLATGVVLASSSGEGTGATVAIGRHNCSFLFLGVKLQLFHAKNNFSECKSTHFYSFLLHFGIFIV
jgi:hypothetical protein